MLRSYQRDVVTKMAVKGYGDGLRDGMKTTQSPDRIAYIAVHNLHAQAGAIGQRYQIGSTPENFTDPQFRLEFGKLWQSWKQVVAENPIIKTGYGYWIKQINSAFNLIVHVKDYRKIPIAWRSLIDALYALSGELTRSADSTIWGVVKEASDALFGMIQSIRQGKDTRTQMNRALSSLSEASRTGGFFGSRLRETIAFLATLKTPEDLQNHLEELMNIQAYLSKTVQMHVVHGLDY